PALVEPVGPAEVARIGLAGGAPAPDPLLMAPELLERGEQAPGAQRPAVLACQPHHAAAAPVDRLEVEDRLHRLDAGARPTPSPSARTTASCPLTVPMRQVNASTSRQWLSARKSGRSRASSAAASAFSNCASHCAAAAATSV